MKKLLFAAISIACMASGCGGGDDSAPAPPPPSSSGSNFDGLRDGNSDFENGVITFLCVIVSLGTSGCLDSGESDPVPQPTLPVPSPVLFAEEPVLCENCNGHGVRFRWLIPTTYENGQPMLDLAGFNIYWGPMSGIYTNRWRRIDNPGIDTAAPWVNTEGMQCWAITAYTLTPDPVRHTTIMTESDFVQEWCHEFVFTD